jgi:hypothetical protein
MVDDTEHTSAVRGSNHRRLFVFLACFGVGILLAAGAVMAYGAASGATASADLDAAEDAARTAAIRDAVLARADAYEVATEARAIADTAGDLLSEEERSQLLAAIEALDAHLGRALPETKVPAEVVSYAEQFSFRMDAVYRALRDARDAVIKTATDRLNASTLASTASREAATDAIAALNGAEPSAELFAALLAAIDAADESHDAAAADPGTPNGGVIGGNGSSGGPGGSGETGGTTPPPGAPSTPPAPPPYTDADARAAVVAAYTDAQPKGSDCDAINSGTWGRNSVPPPPARAGIAEGGWLGFSAWSTGSGGAVNFFACY